MSHLWVHVPSKVIRPILRENEKICVFIFKCLKQFIHTTVKNFDIPPSSFGGWTSGPIYWHVLTLIPAWISNHIHYKMLSEITYPFPTATVKPSKFGNG